MAKAVAIAIILLIGCGGVLTAAQGPRAAVPRSNTYPFAQPLFFRVQGNDCFSTCRELNMKVVQSGRTTTGNIPNPPRSMCAGPADGDTRMDIGTFYAGYDNNGWVDAYCETKKFGKGDSGYYCACLPKPKPGFLYGKWRRDGEGCEDNYSKAPYMCRFANDENVFFGQTDAPDSGAGGCKWITGPEDWNSAEDEFDRLCVKDIVDMACTA